jgi:ABC-2 type transport system ATP-binding protein
VLVLDEPTTGLDPRSRTELWEVLRGLVADGTTLLLTTQYLEEADQLADNIIVIDKGTIIAQGTPTQLKDQAGRASVVLTVASADDLESAAAVLRRTTDDVHIDRNVRRITAKAGGLPDMLAMGEAIAAAGIVVEDLGLLRPSLDDVFLHLTGHRAEPSTDDLNTEAEYAEETR